MSVKGSNRYLQLIEKIFFDRYKDGDEEINFEREDISLAAQVLGIKLPSNLGKVRTSP
jgi:hypothetical protein